MTGRAGRDQGRLPPGPAGAAGQPAQGVALDDGRVLVPILAERLLDSGRRPASRRAPGARRSAAQPGAGGPRASTPLRTVQAPGRVRAGRRPPAAPPLVDRLPGQANWPLRLKVTAVGMLLLVAAGNVLFDLPWVGEGTSLVAQTASRWPTVREGRAGTAVRTVQYLLAARGHRLAIDGIFGPQTEREVRRFQRARNLRVDGVVGSQTWSALVVTMERGLEGYSVRAVQAELSSSRLPTAVDGVFGPITEGNVKAFQRRNGIRATGEVTPMTWGALARARPNDPRGVGFEPPAPMPRPNGTARSRGDAPRDGDDDPETLPATE